MSNIKSVFRYHSGWDSNEKGFLIEYNAIGRGFNNEYSKIEA